MSRITEIKLRAAEAKLEDNLRLATQFSHNPALEEKFLQQAIAAEEIVKKLK